MHGSLLTLKFHIKPIKFTQNQKHILILARQLRNAEKALSIVELLNIGKEFSNDVT